MNPNPAPNQTVTDERPMLTRAVVAEAVANLKKSPVRRHPSNPLPEPDATVFRVECDGTLTDLGGNVDIGQGMHQRAILSGRKYSPAAYEWAEKASIEDVAELYEAKFPKPAAVPEAPPASELMTEQELDAELIANGIDPEDLNRRAQEIAELCKPPFAYRGDTPAYKCTHCDEVSPLPHPCLRPRFRHICPEWDGLEIDETFPEFEACLCFKDKPAAPPADTDTHSTELDIFLQQQNTRFAYELAMYLTRNNQHHAFDQPSLQAGIEQFLRDKR